jgi:hypothetical protein
MKNRYYCYIFVDQNQVEPIYQLVQAAHCAMVIGQKMHKKYDASKIYFQVCKIPFEFSIEELAGTLLFDGFIVERFYEPDVEKTISIGIHPVRSDRREKLRQYELLTFEKE